MITLPLRCLRADSRHLLVTRLAALLLTGALQAASPRDIARELNQAFIQVAEEVSPAVAVITVAHRPDFSPLEDEDNPMWDILPPQFRDRMRRNDGGARRNHPPIFDAQGSGIVIRADGYILTNRHVVAGAEKIKVRFKDGREFDGEIRGTDAQSDLAVIKINAQDLRIARLADSDRVRVGEFAIAIGAPFDLDYSVTIGHVSAKGRSRIIPDPAMDQDFIQTDASINPGNSGGPLVNIDGEVMGINTLIRSLRSGIGFAIPSNLARRVADQLISEGKFTRAWIGVGVTSLKEDSDLQELTQATDSGVVVRRIEKDSPASKSELKTGDVIAKVDGHPVNSAQDLRNEVRSKPIGSSVSLDVLRGRKDLKIKVKLEPWPEETGATPTRTRAAAAAEATDLGMTLKPMSKELAKEAGVDFTAGLLVTQVESGSLAEKKGIQKNDVLNEVDRHAVNNLQEFRNAMKGADVKKGVLLNLVREGVSMLVVLKDAGE